MRFFSAVVVFEGFFFSDVSPLSPSLSLIHILGTGTVVSVDPTDPKVPIVKVKVSKRLKNPKTLAAIKDEPLFKGSPLVVIGRLSVVPLTKEQWDWFLG